jgi:hypothetical protein
VNRLLADGLGSADQAVSVLLLLAAFVFGWTGIQRLRGKAFPSLPLAWAWAATGLCVASVVLALVLPPIIRPDVTSARPSSDARIRILSPTNGARFRGDPAVVPVRLEVTGGTIVARTSTRLVRNEGHVHVYLDGALLTMSFKPSLASRIDVVPGVHRLTAEFVALDHAPFAPRVIATVVFTVNA